MILELISSILFSNVQSIVFLASSYDLENQYQFSNIYIMNANGTGQKDLQTTHKVKPNQASLQCPCTKN